MKKTALALALSGACIVAHAESFFQFEASIGGAFYQRGPDGLWIQDGFTHEWNPTAPAFKVGFTGDLYEASNWGVAWHLDYVWLGMVRSDADAVPDDANYNLRTKGCNGPCLPLANFKGSGHDYGFAAMVEPYVKFGEWKVGVEAGPWIHHNQWTEDITNDRRWSSTPMTLHVDTGPTWYVGAAAGVTLHYRQFDAEVLYFANKSKSASALPPIWQSTIAAFVGMHF